MDAGGEGPSSEKAGGAGGRSSAKAGGAGDSESAQAGGEPDEAIPPPPEAGADGEPDGDEPQRRNLRAEASSLAHLTHKPKNPYCLSCARAM
eukprot:6301380-Lingulodinium_polyedra.AAC.1